MYRRSQRGENAMRVSFIAVSIATFLGGCTTIADQTAQAEQEMDRMMQVYGPACQKLGFPANSDQWRNCVIGLSQKDAMTYYG